MYGLKYGLNKAGHKFPFFVELTIEAFHRRQETFKLLAGALNFSYV